jgi:lipopolysaccharide export system permease protein
MSEGHIVRRPQGNEPPQIVAFDTYAIDLDRFEPKDDLSGLKPRERYFSELAYPARDDRVYRAQKGYFRSELHERFSSPLYPLAFVLIAVAFVGQARSTRQNRVEAVVFAFLLAASLRVAGLGVNNLVVVRGSAVPIMYLLPIAGMVLGLVLIRFNARPYGGASPWDRVVLAASTLHKSLTRWLPARPARSSSRPSGARH